MSAPERPAAPPDPPPRRDPQALAAWDLAALRPHLPLRFTPPRPASPSPKTRYRSQYTPPDPASPTWSAALPDAAARAHLSPLEIALALIDFSPLEPLLAAHYRPSHKGQTPFHPVSLFLALLVRTEQQLGWRELARLLAGEHGQAWRDRCGFREGVTPSEAGLRYFAQALGPALYAELCATFVDMLWGAGLAPQRSTYPGDPPERGVSLVQDGMLHSARHQRCCHLATAPCFQPLPDPPPAEGPPRRPCRAHQNGEPRCACDTPACQARCRLASDRDPAARFIHYDGRNKRRTGDREAPSGRGVDVFGYRSIAERLLDDRLHVAWTLRSTLFPANTDERTVFVSLLHSLRQRFGELVIGEWLDDAGVGYGECLGALWDLGAIRMVDIRADATDGDPAACLQRLYDAEGHPLCPHGYQLHPNGYDYARRRQKWVCRQACSREAGEGVADCPYRTGVGYVVNVGRTLPDGSLRLAREIPYHSEAWRARYARRNQAESRNAQVALLGLKRMRSYGLERATRDVHLADLVINLRTVGRLVQEASTPRPPA